MKNTIEFLPINITNHFGEAVKFRADAFRLSYEKNIYFNPGNKNDILRYRKYLTSRLNEFPAGNVHLFKSQQLIGQIESNITVNRKNEKIGYLNLIYLIPQYRHYGFGSFAHSYIINVFRQLNIAKMGLQVSKQNVKAYEFYTKHGWQLSDLMNIDTANHYMEIKIL